MVWDLGNTPLMYKLAVKKWVMRVLRVIAGLQSYVLSMKRVQNIKNSRERNVQLQCLNVIVTGCKLMDLSAVRKLLVGVIFQEKTDSDF